MPWRSRSKPRSEVGDPSDAPAGRVEAPPSLNGGLLESPLTHALGQKRTLLQAKLREPRAPESTWLKLTAAVVVLTFPVIRDRMRSAAAAAHASDQCSCLYCGAAARAIGPIGTPERCLLRVVQDAQDEDSALHGLESGLLLAHGQDVRVPEAADSFELPHAGHCPTEARTDALEEGRPVA